MQVRNDNYKLKGILGAAGVAISQGLEGIIFTFLGLFFTLKIFTSPGFSIATLTIKELITFALLFLFIRPSRIIKLFKVAFCDRDIRIFLIAGVIGTTFGNLFYLMAIQMGGASYGVILTALYPIFSMTLIRFFAKDKTNVKVLIGMIIAVVSAILFTSVPTLIDGAKFDSLKIAGIILGAVAALFWAIEGFLIHVGLQRPTSKKLAASDIVVIRSIGTALTTLIFLAPLFSLINLASPSWENPYLIMKDIFLSPESLLILLAIAFNLIILRQLHVWAIGEIGAKLTAIIDSNNFLIPPLISIFLTFGNWTFLHSNEPLFEVVPWWTWLLILPLLSGVYIVLINQKVGPNVKLAKIKDH